MGSQVGCGRLLPRGDSINHCQTGTYSVTTKREQAKVPSGTFLIHTSLFPTRLVGSIFRERSHSSTAEGVLSLAAFARKAGVLYEPDDDQVVLFVEI